MPWEAKDRDDPRSDTRHNFARALRVNDEWHGGTQEREQAERRRADLERRRQNEEKRREQDNHLKEIRKREFAARQVRLLNRDLCLYWYRGSRWLGFGECRSNQVGA